MPAATKEMAKDDRVIQLRRTAGALDEKRDNEWEDPKARGASSYNLLSSPPVMTSLRTFSDDLVLFAALDSPHDFFQNF